MWTVQKILIYFILIAFIACRPVSKEKLYVGNEITKVTVAFSGAGCEGECPFNALSTDKDLKIEYYGGPNSKKVWLL